LHHFSLQANKIPITNIGLAQNFPARHTDEDRTTYAASCQLNSTAEQILWPASTAPLPLRGRSSGQARKHNATGAVLRKPYNKLITVPVQQVSEIILYLKP